MIRRLHVCLLASLSFLFANSAFAQSHAPFRLQGNLILVEATLDGLTGEFVLDTGAPCLIVHEDYFEGQKIPWDKKEVVDFNGHASEAKHYATKDFSIGGLSLPKQLALAVDLSSLEKSKGTRILGIIGHAVLEKLEWVIDFGSMEIALSHAVKKSFAFYPNTPPTNTFDMTFSGHIPCLAAVAGGKKLRLGLDTGAEINLLEEKHLKHLAPYFEEMKKRQVKGITRFQQTGGAGVLQKIFIQDCPLAHIEITAISLTTLNEHLPFALDGILGVPFLQQGGRVGVDYAERKIRVWANEGGLLVGAEAAAEKK